jgi:hypothetical protein
MPKLSQQPDTTPISSIVDQLTELYAFVDDFWGHSSRPAALAAIAA